MSPIAQYLSLASPFDTLRPDGQFAVCPNAVDPHDAFTIKQVDFDPQPSPSTYRIHPAKADRVQGFPLRQDRTSTDSHVSHDPNCQSKDRSPSTGSSSSFNFDHDVRHPHDRSASDVLHAHNWNPGSLSYHWTAHRCDMSPLSPFTREDRRYRDDILWAATNAQSNEEIRSALFQASKELRRIKGLCHEDGFEMQRSCASWEVSFTKTTSQLIDFYYADWLEPQTRDLALDVCTSCLALELPSRGIWNACERVREILAPDNQYQDDYVGELESSDIEVLPCAPYSVPQEELAADKTLVTRETDDARYFQQRYRIVSTGVPAHYPPLLPSRYGEASGEPSSDDMLFECDV